MLTALRSAPKPVLWLGLMGLLPFLGLGGWLVLVGNNPWLRSALIDYAAVIASFVGALQWGLGMRVQAFDPQEEWRLYGSGVLPSLLAWAALGLPSGVALWWLAATFVAVLWLDFRAMKLHGAPAWYVPLRTALTTIVVLVLVLVATLG